MSTKYILRPTRIHVLPEGEPWGGPNVTVVETANVGKSINLWQNYTKEGLFIHDEEQWNAIAAAVADMFSEIEKHSTGGSEQ